MNTIFTNYAEKKAKQFLNLLQGYTKGIRMTVILILLLMGVSNAWAGDPSISGFGLQFQDDGGHWFKTGTKGGDGIMDIYLGSKTNLKIVYIYANGNKNSGNICDNSYFKYEIYGETGTQNWGGIRHSSVDWETPTFKWGINNSSTAQIDLVKNRKPGDYRMEFLISFEGNSNSNYCGSWYDCKYSGGNWKFSWSIPDPTITITGANALVVGTSTNIKASMSNYPIGATLTKVQVSGNIASSKSTTGTSDNITVSSVTPNASGKNGIKVTVTVTFGTGGTKDYVYNYNVTPPAINNFQVTPTGYISGSGTSADPYIIPYNQSLTLSLSGSKAKTDANSTVQYNTSGTWNTTTSRTISNITSATKTSVTVKMRCHNSTASLSGTESSKIIYYRSEDVYTVTFDANGHGTAPTAQTVSQGSKATQPAAPSATGYTFGGWYRESNCTNAFDFNTAINANITLYAKWTANKYTVTLSNQGATTAGTASVQATYGSAMPSATMPQKTGYTFGGYYTSNNGGGTQYYNANGASARTWNIAENTTLYAKWTANQYTITYKDQNNANFSGLHASGFPTKHTYGTATTLKTATKTGYTFDGWHTDAACTNKVTSLGATAYTANITLYAKWTATPTTIYLKPSANWKQANARFAIYAFGGGSGDKWVDMTPVGCNDEYYMVDVPAGYTAFNFVRMNPATTENNWNNDWNQTGNLSIPDDGKNLYDMTKIYLEPNANWKTDAARFAAYFFNNDNNYWMSMSSSDGIYSCAFPPTDIVYDKVSFVRMKGGDGDNNWGNRLNQSKDIDLMSGYNQFTLEDGKWGKNDKGENDDNMNVVYLCKWTTLDLPKITITNSNPTYGNIIVTTVGGTTITSDMEVDWDTQVIVSIQPKAGYAVKSSSINIGGNAETIQSGKTYTICNNTTISVSFEEKGEWYLAGIDDNWAVREEYKLIDGKILVELKKEYDDNGSIKKPGFKLVQKVGEATTWYGGGFTFKSLYPTDDLIVADGEGNHCSIEPVHDGDYLFVWDENTKTLTIEYPDVIFLHGTFNGWKDKPSHALHDRDAKVYLQGSTNYAFKVVEKGIYYTTSASNKALTTQLTMDDPTEHAANCTYYASVTGLYTFHFDKETRVLTVTQPADNTLANGDYRLYYTGSPADHYSDHVKQQTTGRDIVSLFVKVSEGDPTIKLQRYNGSTWINVSEEVYDVNKIDAIANDEHMYKGDGVWNFIITQVNGVAKVAIDETHRYTGNYYIRTEVAGGGWYEYKIPENQMFFSSYARDNENFDHYFCKYIDIDESSNDVRFNVANDYCSQLCPNNFDNDDLVSGDMPASGNVRFMYFSKTNTLGRAYLDGSSTNNFLRITNATNLYDADGKNSITTAKFTDLQNWIYQVDVQATGNSRVKLEAIYNGNTQYFKGGTNQTVPLLASTSNDKHKIRLIYNFKTNHLVCAWLAAGETIDGNNQTLGADMMLIRKNQNLADQLHFNPNTNTLSDVKNAYAVMTFTEDFIKNEEKTIYERALYWVSFPYDVLISQVFGFGEYGEHWIIQRYRGDLRAQKGLFSDSGTYWEYITNTNTILEKGKGYVLALDLDKVKTSFIHGIESVSLYFPSNGELGIIQGDDPTAVDVPEHKCNINLSNDPDGDNKDRRDRRIYDSHWNMIGVPRFADIKEFNTNNELAPVTYSADSLSFYYEYLPKTDKYQTRIVTADFQAMYGYMVQFAGRINWTEKKAIKPDQLAARRNSDNTEPEKVSLRLEIAQDEEMADQTFVQLQQEGATPEFDMNLDLTKIINSGANIYTLAGEQRIQSAGNALPMGEVVVPVGVQIATEGEYTFRMPDGTGGMVVELIDYYTNTRTNLLLFDYTVTLPKGTNEGRFALHIQPSKSGVTTNIDQINGGSIHHEGVQKYLIDGQLYIVREGEVFDAQGHRL